jgi:hypothetical protein
MNAYNVQVMFQYSGFETNIFCNLNFLLNNMNLTFRIFYTDQQFNIVFAEIIYISIFLTDLLPKSACN